MRKKYNGRTKIETNLSEGQEIYGSLNLSRSRMRVLPKNLTVHGSVRIEHSCHNSPDSELAGRKKR